MLQLSDIRRIQVELTTRCNARCPMCMRNYRGYDYNSGYPVTELSLEDFQKIVNPDMLKQLMIPAGLQIQGILFNGNLGDFSNAKDAKEIVAYIVSHGAKVTINTNGSARTPDWWAGLAMPGVEIGFALDGLEDTHSLYRQDTDWYRIIENAQAFIKAGGNAVWRFIPFEHNRHQEAACRKLAVDLGFRKFENIYDGRDRGPVYNRAGEFSHWLGQPDAEAPPIRDMVQSHITWYDSQTIKHHRDRETLDLFCTHKVNREIYIAANGDIFPCCYLGFYPKTMHHPGNKELAPMVQENNALEYDLEHCIQWFNAIEESWKKPSIAQGRTYQCVSTCNRP